MFFQLSRRGEGADVPVGISSSSFYTVVVHVPSSHVYFAGRDVLSV